MGDVSMKHKIRNFIMRREIFLVPMIAFLMLGSGAGRADDTDVYINPGAGLPPGSEPIIMFSLDWRPNLTATACQNGVCQFLVDEGHLEAKDDYVFFDLLRAVLRKVFEPLEGVKVGLMLNHDHVQNCAGWQAGRCGNGGYIAMGATSFYRDDTINGAKAQFHEILKNIPLPVGFESHSYQGKELFFELFRYLTGQGVFNGHNGFTDYGTDTTLNLTNNGEGMPDDKGPPWDRTVEQDGSSNTMDYVSPLEGAGECTRIYTVNFMFQVSNQDDDSDKAMREPVHAGGFGSPQRQFEDVVRYLYDADLGDNRYGDAPNIVGKQNVISYFIVKDEASKGQMAGRYARAGGTGAPLTLSEDPQELIRTLNDVFSQIISVSTTFVAASVPVNVFNRAEITDNVYIALFQVDGEAKPYWVGNVKKLRLQGAESTSTNALLVDAKGDPAIAGDGRINYSALTYWTLPNALPPPNTDENEVAGVDGRSVARGGAGQRTPGMISGSPGQANGLGGRTIYYNDSDSSLAPLNVNDVTAAALQTALGAATVEESADLIRYMRGLDVDDDDGDQVTDEARRWIFGDPLHSRPLPLNYGALSGYSVENPAIYLAVGSNDGMIRMIRNTTTGGAESGGEVWAFMPQTSMYAQKRLRTNAAAAGHPYTVDGAPVAFFLDKDSDGTIEPEQGDKVYLYFGLRRGGKAYYAMDITNPESPELLWSIGKGSAGFEELGYTFSTPRVGLVRVGTDEVPIVMFGGGYDMNKDDRSGVGTDDSEGNAIYVVNAATGDLICKAVGTNGTASADSFEHAKLVDSIPSPLTVADMDGDGYTDRIVVGDTGGNVWRADLTGNDPGGWKLSLLASLGRHAMNSSGKDDDRRFFHRPDLVPSRDEHGSFDAVLIGSGDRPDPLDIGGMVDNYFYMIKDRNIAVGAGVDTGLDHAYLGDVTDNCLQVNAGSCVVDLGDGWKLQLETPGEKVLATPITIAGNVYFTSYIPQGEVGVDSCAPSEGNGRLWALDIQNAFSVVNYNTADDTEADPDAATTKADRFTQLLSSGIPAEVVSIPPNKILRPDLQIDNVNTSVRWRTFWHLEEEEL
jgi:type IV pilus assembly protein PilY1